MSKDEFHDTLRQYLHRRPFRPFFVQLKDGRRVVIKELPVVFDDGAASFIDWDDGGALVEFFHNEVKKFAFVKKERTS